MNHDGFCYKVTWYERGHMKIEGGFTFDRANSFAARIQNKIGVREVRIERTAEIFGGEIVAQLY